jgi:hypothetical protein
MARSWLVLLIPISIAFLVFLHLTLRRRRQAQFIRKRLSIGQKSNDLRRVIASLSTLPDRIDNLGPTIRCLLDQTRSPDEIVLAIPDFSVRQEKRYVLPEYLAKFPRLRILRATKDWGPATKFIPAIQEELAAGRLETLIMIVDDDRTYPRDALETYLSYSEELPNAALCFRGGSINRKSTGCNLKISLGSQLRTPQPVTVMTGCGSYLIQPRFFDRTLWDYSDAPAAAFYVDDIWISGYLERQGVEKYIVPASGTMRTVRDQLGTMTLLEVPSGRERSNYDVVNFFQEKYGVLCLP